MRAVLKNHSSRRRRGTLLKRLAQSCVVGAEVPVAGSRKATWSQGRKTDSADSDGRDVRVLENLARNWEMGSPSWEGSLAESIWWPGLGLRGHSLKKLHGAKTPRGPSTCREGHRGRVCCQSGGRQQQETGYADS